MWDRLFEKADKESALKLEVVDVRASWWAIGREEKEIEDEAKRRLKERGIEIPEPPKK